VLGLIAYAAWIVGLGALWPASRARSDMSVGTRCALGVALLTIVSYLAHVVLRVPLVWTAAIVTALALGGLARAIPAATSEQARNFLLHPCFVLPALAVLAVAAYGGVDYRPFTTDEFTNWIGAARLIQWYGGYHEARPAIQVPGYPPGWHLLLVLPWQLGGDATFGLSAAAPLALHIAVLGLLFDIFRATLRRSLGASAPAAAVAWALLLLFMAGEGMGRLWTHELLIEQPQIYILSAAALLILRSEALGAGGRTSDLAAGLLLGCGYLLKSAVLAALPAAAVLAALPLLDTRQATSRRVADSTMSAAALLGPTLLLMLSWTWLAPSEANCYGSPLAAIAGTSAIPTQYDWLDLAHRFGAAVTRYILSYKTIVLVAAFAGMGWALRLGLFRATLFCAGFAAVYFAALYWYHLACFGDYYFYELNSIPRFSRVPVQVLHTVGLALLVVAAARHAGTFGPAVAARLNARPSLAALGVTIAVLGGWQEWLLYRNVADMSTRVYQGGDPRVGEMARAAARIAGLAGTTLPARPRLAVLDQEQDADVLAYARFFALRRGPAGPEPIFEIYDQVSWAPAPRNTWQVRTSGDALAATLQTMDILWPIRVDPWLLSVLATMGVDNGCLSQLPAMALIRAPAEGGVFRCTGKDR
jgi:hypothetical protein